jgi:hypothetical protein
LIRRSEDRIGLKSGWFLTVIPYSVSMPMTFGMAMRPLYEARVKRALKKNPDRCGGRGADSGAADATLVIANRGKRRPLPDLRGTVRY